MRAALHVLDSLQRLVRYRALAFSLVARELRARYRGSVLGFLWTFVNPLLTLAVYAFVFGIVMPGARAVDVEPYPLFLFCGLLPWIWFESAVAESSTSLTASGSLLRKVMFPAEILPLVTVLSGLVNFALGLVVYSLVALAAGRLVLTTSLLLLPVVVAVQLVFSTGLALLLSSLSVHFRDLRDLLAHALRLWFFGTPIIYSYAQAPERLRWVLDLNPLTPLVVAYQTVLFGPGSPPGLRPLTTSAVVALASLIVGYGVFDRLRDTFAEDV
jgi:ABC-type polysaccharide/polyol phosphate export permease